MVNTYSPNAFSAGVGWAAGIPNTLKLPNLAAKFPYDTHKAAVQL